jgi:hypothetical protein
MLHQQEMQRLRDEVEKRRVKEHLASEKMIAAHKQLELDQLRCAPCPSALPAVRSASFAPAARLDPASLLSVTHDGVACGVQAAARGASAGARQAACRATRARRGAGRKRRRLALDKSGAASSGVLGLRRRR